MSSGQKPRTREHFPKMKIRGARRRSQAESDEIERLFARLATGGFSFFEAFGEALVEAVAAVGQMFSGVIDVLAAGVAAAVQQEELERREYVQSERYQLDQLAVRYGADPTAHLDAIAEFFSARACRELDEVLDRLERGREG